MLLLVTPSDTRCEKKETSYQMQICLAAVPSFETCIAPVMPVAAAGGPECGWARLRGAPSTNSIMGFWVDALALALEEAYHRLQAEVV